jgi:hypothetical protein
MWIRKSNNYFFTWTFKWCNIRNFYPFNRNSGAVSSERPIYHFSRRCKHKYPRDGCGQKQLFDVTDTYNLTVTINIPTRVTEITATFIDQIITNILLIYRGGK